MRSILVHALALFLATPTLAQQGEASAPSKAEPTRPVAEIVAEILSAAPEGTRYGLVVQKREGGEILAIAADERFIPASNTKIYTTLAAYRQLAALQRAAEGTGVRIEPAPDGAVDVVLEGRGEATVSSARDCRTQCLATLADAVAARARRVRNVVGDASWYPDERWSAGMSWNNIPFRYGTATGALVVDDNEIVVSVAPGRIGQPGTIESDGYYRIDNLTRTVAGADSALDLRRLPGSDTLVVDGTIGTGADPSAFRLGLDDPAHRAAWRLARLLEERGVQVTGDVTSRYRPLLPSDDPVNRAGAPAARMPKEEMLARLPPEQIAADIVTINKQSQNLHAELMLRRAGKLTGSGSVADGQRALEDLLDAADLPRDGFVLADGSGMSSYNRLNPRITSRLLAWAARQEWGDAWRASLPVGGIDGTLARRFAETPLEGRIFAKTGSLNASRALSGYMIAASGEQLVFSAVANDIPPGGEAAALAALDAALVAIAAEN
ncbi:D-alanyl-D-alanine carboxypeptidase/D-alanyl-D-alanine-endopeptidase [Alteriqipengyuania lutimaris]|uniref:D-alanyl-D-alanine carboxypeptidase/D-alanyl-D-alanine-endopeptidase n=1 Tax=Alteriqipengyuania lutimaris TaxID=1538146 RepID=A0A395LN00_9SPHN|nr:D-alanyl-D-alanine carboxypeptidase [Alteriqipengyuania lutimaris]MBB3035425.1 D-alanyl-D-alanine carboxypeptidase/D-alanyl-D-alanine-endopeptidase (penicillin-binding protein 4) [Alteriqipengyuania lutimaris]RDS76000.1 D-alanyl-D-alanine carboxypeptidase/D-alanyl-D-alanine-endopeptidase [Alteriqipengyuania lutimaris]